MSSFPPAKQAEIIRSNQKDGYYIAYIKGALADITQSWLGRYWVYWSEWPTFHNWGCVQWSS